MFVELTNTQIWTVDNVSSCRGLIATGFNLKQFHVTLTGESQHHIDKHSAWDCRTVYREDAEHGSQNPIAGNNPFLITSNAARDRSHTPFPLQTLLSTPLILPIRLPLLFTH